MQKESVINIGDKMPKTIELSHSSIALAQSCWKKWYWKYVEKLTPLKQSDALTLGRFIHSAFDMHYSGFTKQEVVDWITKTADEEIAKAIPEDVESLTVIKYTVLGMWLFFPFQQYGTFANIKPEVSFRIKPAYALYFRGRIDGLVDDGKKWIRELKSTGLTFNQFERRSLISPQATDYTLAMKVLGHDVEGVMYDYIKKPLLRKRVNDTQETFGRRIMEDYRDRPEIYFNRHYVYRKDFELKRRLDLIINLGKEVRSRIRTNNFPRNMGSCFNFNAECPYAKICHCEKPDPLTVQVYFERS